MILNPDYNRNISNSIDAKPLISVVITCYNHAHYLKESINSVFNQTYSQWELLVVDDGSTDHTAEIAKSYDKVQYIYQDNAGLSAARNKGLSRSNGKYLVFLDADDRLLPKALEFGMTTMLSSPGCGFVFGAHRFIDQAGMVKGGEQTCDFGMEQYPFLYLLKRNFIGMHATVLYSRTNLESIHGFDTALEACEDYDVYLKIACKSPIKYHHNIIAEYRKHDENMSGNPAKMLKASKGVLKSHKNVVPKERYYQEAYKSGLLFWSDYYGKPLYKLFKQNLKGRKLKTAFSQFIVLLVYAPRSLYGKKSSLRSFSIYSLLLKFYPRLLSGLLKARNRKVQTPSSGNVVWGDFDRLKPISKHFGFDRGTLPVDRFYIEGFLFRNERFIKGNVLEIGERIYTQKFGKEKVVHSHIFHVNEQNPGADFTGDIASSIDLPSDFYDCVIFTQTLQYIFDFPGAIRQLYRVLKPGGVLLLTAPGLSPVSKDEWSDLWNFNFTCSALKKMFNLHFPSSGEEVQLESHGNVKVAAAALYGLTAEELAPEDLTYKDPLYQVVNTVLAIKS